MKIESMTDISERQVFDSLLKSITCPCILQNFICKLLCTDHLCRHKKYISFLHDRYKSDKY